MKLNSLFAAALFAFSAGMAQAATISYSSSRSVYFQGIGSMGASGIPLFDVASPDIPDDAILKGVGVQFSGQAVGGILVLMGQSSGPAEISGTARFSFSYGNLFGPTLATQSIPFNLGIMDPVSQKSTGAIADVNLSVFDPDLEDFLPETWPGTTAYVPFFVDFNASASGGPLTVYADLSHASFTTTVTYSYHVPGAASAPPENVPDGGASLLLLGMSSTALLALSRGKSGCQR